MRTRLKLALIIAMHFALAFSGIANAVPPENFGHISSEELRDKYTRTQGFGNGIDEPNRFEVASFFQLWREKSTTPFFENLLRRRVPPLHRSDFIEFSANYQVKDCLCADGTLRWKQVMQWTDNPAVKTRVDKCNTLSQKVTARIKHDGYFFARDRRQLLGCLEDLHKLFENAAKKHPDVKEELDRAMEEIRRRYQFIKKDLSNEKRLQLTQAYLKRRSFPGGSLAELIDFLEKERLTLRVSSAGYNQLQWLIWALINQDAQRHGVATPNQVPLTDSSTSEGEFVPINKNDAVEDSSATEIQKSTPRNPYDDFPVARRR